MFGDEHDFKFQMDVDSANHMDVTPEVTIADNSDSSLYDSRHGFSDVDLLSSLKGFTDDVPHGHTQDSVNEFIADANHVEFNSQGEPMVHQHASHDAEINDSLPTSDSGGIEIAKFDQDDR